MQNKSNKEFIIFLFVVAIVAFALLFCITTFFARSSSTSVTIPESVSQPLSKSNIIQQTYDIENNIATNEVIFVSITSSQAVSEINPSENISNNTLTSENPLVKNENIIEIPQTQEETIDEDVNQEIIPLYYIKINYKANTITIYSQDENGIYSIPVRAMTCSTGSGTPRSGIYPLTSYKGTWVPLFGNLYGQYGWQIVGNVMMHSVPYTKIYDKSSLMYSKYDQLGSAVSMGCIRLTVEDAKWIYDNCIEGTNVEFYGDSDPGPLGKPQTAKISPYAPRNWDPTDPDSKNPWHQYDWKSELLQ